MCRSRHSSRIGVFCFCPDRCRSLLSGGLQVSIAAARGRQMPTASARRATGVDCCRPRATNTDRFCPEGVGVRLADDLARSVSKACERYAPDSPRRLILLPLPGSSSGCGPDASPLLRPSARIKSSRCNRCLSPLPQDNRCLMLLPAGPQMPTASGQTNPGISHRVKALSGLYAHQPRRQRFGLQGYIGHGRALPPQATQRRAHGEQA